MSKFYYVPGLGYWSIEKEKFIEQTTENDEVITVGVSDGEDKMEALKALLEYEGYQTDTLMSRGVQLERLIAQNKDYLLNMFILTSLGIEIPDEAKGHFEELRNEISGFPENAKLDFLRN